MLKAKVELENIPKAAPVLYKELSEALETWLPRYQNKRCFSLRFTVKAREKRRFSSVYQAKPPRLPSGSKLRIGIRRHLGSRP